MASVLTVIGRKLCHYRALRSSNSRLEYRLSCIPGESRWKLSSHSTNPNTRKVSNAIPRGYTTTCIPVGSWNYGELDNDTTFYQLPLRLKPFNRHQFPIPSPFLDVMNI